MSMTNGHVRTVTSDRVQTCAAGSLIAPGYRRFLKASGITKRRRAASKSKISA